MTSPQPRSVVVVGAGLAGLTAALTAADARRPVTVLEARAHPGGRARTTTTEPASTSTRARTRSTAAARRGRRSPASASRRAARRPTPPAPTACAPTAPSAPLPGSTAACCARRLVGPAAKLELARLLARPARLAAHGRRPGQSMQDWIDARSRDADVRSLLALLARVATYCGDLDALDAAAGVDQMTQALGARRRLPRRRLAAAGRRAAAAGARARHHRPHPRQGRTRSTRATTASPCAPPHGDLDADAVVLAAGGPRRGRRHGCTARAPRCTRWAARRATGGRVGARPRAAPLPVPDPPHHVRPRRADVPLGAHAVRAARSRYGGGEVAHLLWYGDARRRPAAAARGAARPRPAGLARRRSSTSATATAWWSRTAGRSRAAAAPGARRWRCPTCRACSWPATGSGPRAARRRGVRQRRGPRGDRAAATAPALVRGVNDARRAAPRSSRPSGPGCSASPTG